MRGQLQEASRFPPTFPLVLCPCYDSDILCFLTSLPPELLLSSHRMLASLTHSFHQPVLLLS